MKTHIGVLGPNKTDDEQYELGKAVGREIAKAGATLFCGGLGGMMQAAAERLSGRPTRPLLIAVTILTSLSAE